MAFSWIPTVTDDHRNWVSFLFSFPVYMSRLFDLSSLSLLTKISAVQIRLSPTWESGARNTSYLAFV